MNGNAPEDLGPGYADKVSQRSRLGEVAEMQAWLAAQQNGPGAPVATDSGAQPDAPARPLPAAPPTRRSTRSDSGRPVSPDEGTGIMRNVAEIPGAMYQGVNDAVYHATDWAIGPLARWIQDNMTGQMPMPKYDPKTPVGQATKGLTEFMTGYVPFLKGMGYLGVAKTIAPTAAAALSAFATQDPSAPRLSDLWKKLELPQNVLTDYLAHPAPSTGDLATGKADPKESELEGRFKNALEMAGLGPLTDGIVYAARVIRAGRSVKGAAAQETAYLESKYGKVDEDTLDKIVGGSKDLPVVETKAVSPEKVAAKKIVKGAEDTDALEPRAIVRNKGIAPPEIDRSLIAPHQGKEIELMEKGDKPAGLFSKGDFGALSEEPQARVAAEKNGWATLETGDTLYVGKTPEAAQAVKAADALAFGPQRDAALGKALGYTPAQISEFVKSMAGREGYAKVPKSVVLPKDFDTYINFGRIDEPDQIKFALGKMAEAAQPTIDEAKRGVITHVETQKLADDLGMTVTDLLNRRHGQPFNAEEAVAARQLWSSSAERLVDLAKKAMDKNAGDLDLFAFRRQMAIHSAIQSEVIGARTETARALSSWNIRVGGDIERARAVDSVMQATGGVITAKEIAHRLTMLADAGATKAALGKFAEKGAAATTVDALKEVWINGMLSNPTTHIVNMTSNLLAALNYIPERVAAGAIRSVTGGEGVEMGEAVAAAYGMVTGVRDAWRVAAKSLKTGESQWMMNNKATADAMQRDHAISSKAFGLNDEGAMGKFVDFVGNTFRIPTKMMGAEDEFSKSIAYRMELHAQAARQGVQEGFRGADLSNRVAEIIKNPPENIRIASMDNALYQTFNNEVGGVGKALMGLRRGTFNPLILVFPFVRTPINLARYAFERTPFAPLVGQWRADIQAGGARSDLALARMSTGTMAMLAAMDLADKGLITGPMLRGGKDSPVTEAANREGIQPYSAKVGNRWFSYNRLDPFGMTIGFAASIAEAVRKGELDNDSVDEWQEVTAMAINAVSQATISKTYLQGFSQFMEMMTDPQRYTKQEVQSTFASFLPFTGLMGAAKNITDPVQREANDPWEAVQARIAVLSKRLTPRRDLWGREMVPQGVSGIEGGWGAAHDLLSPVQSKEEKPDPTDAEMVRLNHGVQRISKQTAFDGVQANLRFYPHVYDDYQRLAGNDIKHPAWGMGAHDFLNSVVTGASPMSPVYNSMTDESRKAFISSTIADYRKLAQRQILSDPKHGAFQAEIQRLKDIHQQSRLPMEAQ